MLFENLMKDKVTLVKHDGRQFKDIKASVQPDKIFTNDANIPIEEGDIFERTLPNGIVERYKILDAGFYTGIGSIKSHYQSSVKKETRIEPNRQPTQVVYNLIGPNARVNIQSVDTSMNLVQIEPKELFVKLREEIQQVITDKSLSAKLLEKVSELQQTQGTTKFIEKYREFIAIAADHVAILAPFIPALSQMLG